MEYMRHSVTRVVAGLAVIVFLALPLALPSRAQYLENPRYEIQFDEEDEAVVLEEPTPVPRVTPRDSIVYGSEREDFDTRGYVLRNSFPFSTGDANLRITVSDTGIAFPDAVSGQPMDRNVSMTVSSDSPFAYQLSVQQDGPLRSGTGDTIPDASCDTRCTSSTARPWKSTGSFGFGYAVRSTDAAPGLRDPTAFAPLASSGNGSDWATLASSSFAAGTRESQVTFRLNPPPTLQEATYQHIIKVIALPKL
jgi:hypothetical protein